MEPNHIDKLLERYLLLLDEYTTLRSTLVSVQSAMYQNIARANFSGERGIRYGQDFYDDRMQATRRVEVGLSEADDEIPQFHTVVTKLDIEIEDKSEKEGEDKDEHEEEEEGGKKEERELEEGNPTEDEAHPEKESDVDSAPASSDDEENEKKAQERKRGIERSRDPLRWFGLVTPMPLRLAQTQAIQLVETVIPRLASIDAEMKDVEIEVRRARKRRAKAEAGSAKERDDVGEVCAGVEASSISA